MRQTKVVFRKISVTLEANYLKTNINLKIVLRKILTMV